MESPGTAPGSEPCITGAFIAIGQVTLNTCNISARAGLRKAWAKENAPKANLGRVWVCFAIRSPI